MNDPQAKGQKCCYFLECGICGAGVPSIGSEEDTLTSCPACIFSIHSGILAWRIPGTGEPGGLPSMGSHRVGHDWSDLAAAAGYTDPVFHYNYLFSFSPSSFLHLVWKQFCERIVIRIVILDRIWVWISSLGRILGLLNKAKKHVVWCRREGGSKHLNVLECHLCL